MTVEAIRSGPVKAWVEPDRWAFVRAFPAQAGLLGGALLLSAWLALWIHPGFWVAACVLVFRHVMAEAVLRDLWREGMLHPACVLGDAPARLATLVRLDGERGPEDALVVTPLRRRFKGGQAPWGGLRAAVVISGTPPKLKPLTVDLATGESERGEAATERLPASQWDALERAIEQVGATAALGIHPVQLGSEPWYGRLCEVEQQGSLPDYVSYLEATAWCAGLPSIEMPAMAVPEQARVRKLRRRALSRCLLSLGLGLSLAAAVVGALWLKSTSVTSRPLASLLVGAAVAALLGTPLALLEAVRAARLTLLLAGDLRAKRVRRFLGRLSSFDSLALDPDLARLLRSGLFRADAAAEQDMTVLPVSQRVLHVNGRWVEPTFRVRLEEVAPPPEVPIKVALPPDIQAERNEEVAVARRRFTELERSELLRHSFALRPAGAIFWASSAFASGGVLALGLRGFRYGAPTAAALVAIAAWVLVTWGWLGRRRLARNLEEDAELGWVVTVDAAMQGEVADELPAQGVETLLHGRLDWTVNRRPATWRRYGPRRPS